MQNHCRSRYPPQFDRRVARAIAVENSRRSTSSQDCRLSFCDSNQPNRRNSFCTFSLILPIAIRILWRLFKFALFSFGAITNGADKHFAAVQWCVNTNETTRRFDSRESTILHWWIHFDFALRLWIESTRGIGVEEGISLLWKVDGGLNTLNELRIDRVCASKRCS